MIRSTFDLAIIGAGVVGCAMARRFTLGGASVLVLEKAADPLEGASKGNSGILHTAYDAAAGSLEAECMRAGYAEYMGIKDQMNLPTRVHGAMVAAFTEHEASELSALRARSIDNQVTGVTLCSRVEVLDREPHLSPAVVAGLFVPGECVIDPWATPLAYLKQAMENGAEVRLQSEVLSGKQIGEVWNLTTASGAVAARTVINCAGIFGDLVDRQVLGEANFRIRPRKGQFVVFDKPAAELIEAIILPVPMEHTKGVLLTRTVFGNLLVGPTAEEQTEREPAIAEEQTAHELVEKAIAMVPALARVQPIASYAGVRPATDKSGYILDIRRERRWITVGGIRSTGLTSALGLANVVFERYCEAFAESPRALSNPRWPTEARRGDPVGGSDELVCGCEGVTREDIQRTFEAALPPRTLGALKRETHVAMGRCQGERCLPRIKELWGSELLAWLPRPSMAFSTPSRTRSGEPATGHGQ